MPLELSIVIPCLNEAETLSSCLLKASKCIADAGFEAEIIVADNGSTDGSIEIAQKLGARVIHVAEKGYGNALMSGIASAQGKYIVMGDADDSYDFFETPKFVSMLREGYDLVQGCRLPSGGGRVMPGAMPLSHRWIGNPMFSSLARHMFHVPLHDIYCGLRGFTKELYDRLNLRCTGMEFATEMIIKSVFVHARITEVPITLHPDGRILRKPHLRTIRDGWRTLRFFLIFCPRWLFLYPGLLLGFLGLAGYLIAMPGLPIGGVSFDAHTLLFSTLALLMGYQSLLFGIFSKTFAINEGLLPEDPQLNRFFKIMYLERGLLLGGVMCLTGLFLLLLAVGKWWTVHFGHLDYSRTMRVVIPGVTLTALGFQTILSSFFTSILGMQRRR